MKHAKDHRERIEGSPERLLQRAGLTAAIGGNGGRRTARGLLGLREASATAREASGKLGGDGGPRN